MNTIGWMNVLGVIAFALFGVTGNVAAQRACAMAILLVTLSLAVGFALEGNVSWAALGFAGVFLIGVWLWRNRSRGKRRPLKALGYKARARLAAMLRAMPKPGPARRPAPQGAHLVVR